MKTPALKPEHFAVRCHDVAVGLDGREEGDVFERMPIVGQAARLALALRGVPAVEYDLLRRVALYHLKISKYVIEDIVRVLAEAEIVQLHTEGSTIKTVLPNIQFYEDLLTQLGDYAKQNEKLTEAEELALLIMERLSASPMVVQSLYNEGAESKLVDKVIATGEGAGLVVTKRARGKTVVSSPLYFNENPGALADLVAKAGSANVARVYNLLETHQGYPLKLIEQTRALGSEKLSSNDLAIIGTLAREGIANPPVIATEHSGENHFVFTPRPGVARVAPEKRHIYESAMAIVAAVRQGQLLPKEYRIRSPSAVLRKLKERGWIGATSEASEQYRMLVAGRIGTLEPYGYGHRFVLRDAPENREALDIAIKLVRGEPSTAQPDEDAKLAFLKGHSYLESLVGRQRLVATVSPTAPDAETSAAIDTFFLGGGR